MNLRSALLSLLFATALAGCSRWTPAAAPGAELEPAANPEDDRPRVPESLMPGMALTDDYVVRVVSPGATCSGTLIEDNLVLTAHHCVAGQDEYGAPVAENVEPARVSVELGGDYLPWGEVGVRAIVTPPCGHDAGIGDIAFLVLERRLVGISTVEPRLDRGPKPREVLDPVGFGRCALTADAVRRKTREGGRVDQIRASRFAMEASICPGDSGGPVIDRESGEVVGVVSRSVMDGSDQTRGTSVFTRLDYWRPLFARAALIAEGRSPAEVPPVTDGCPAP